MVIRMPRTFNPETDQLQFTFDYNLSETEALRQLPDDPINIDVLRRIALWKINRIIHVQESTLDLLNQIKQADDLTIESELSRRAIEALVNSRGVRLPMASAFLKFIRPDVFPIIDARAYRAIYGQRIQGHQYSLPIYLDYARRIREIAGTLDMPLSEIDEQLYCFDRQHNGRINP